MKNCAVRSKMWRELKAGARERYKELGDNRLESMIYVQQGDRKVSYVEPDYVAGGCYKKVIGVHNKKQAIVAIKHVGGTVAKLKKPLVMNYVISKNQWDRDAKLVADDAENEIPVMKIFTLAGLEHKIPEYLAHVRVGQATSPLQSKPHKSMLEIRDGQLAVTETDSKKEDGGDGQPATLAKSPGRAQKRNATVAECLPPGPGCVAKSRGAPNKKR